MTSLSLSIRPVRLRDLPGLFAVSSILSLNQPEASLAAYHPAQAAMSSILPGRHRTRMFVAQADEGILAFAHFVPEPPDRRWQLIALGASTGVYDVTPLWEELIERSIVAAGLRGVKRLYARAPSGSPALSAMRATGFQSYANEALFLSDSIRVPEARIKLRTQEQTDTWAIHQLYNAVTPRQVQYAEAYTSHRWDLSARRSAPNGVATAGWLLEEAFQVVAYVRATSFGASHSLELIVHPDWMSVAGDVIDAAIAKIAAQRKVTRIFFAIRGYQQELTTALQTRGFRQYGDLTLSVKYTAARALAPSTVEQQVQPEGVLERLPKPKRAPSFMWKRGDENAQSSD
jgi:hypothetical protein